MYCCCCYFTLANHNLQFDACRSLLNEAVVESLDHRFEVDGVSNSELKCIIEECFCNYEVIVAALKQLE